MTVKRVGVLSAGKVAGLLYFGLGLILGLFFSLFSFLGFMAGLAQREGGEALLGLVFGVGAVIFLPVFYGILGFIGGVISAALYNLVSSLVGGLEVEIE